jgi:hypothetical protein
MSVFATDEEAVAGFPHGLTIRATRGNAIVWFLPYRRTEGVIELPDKFQPISVEALIVHDNSPNALEQGVMVGVSRSSGTNFEYRGHQLSVVPGSALILVNTKYSPEEA